MSHLRAFLSISLIACTAANSSCVTSETKKRSLELDESRSTGGVVVEGGEAGAQTDDLQRLLDSVVAESKRQDAAANGSPQARPDRPSNPEGTPGRDDPSGATEDEGESSRRHWPASAGKLVDLPAVNETVLNELLDDVVLTLTAENGYREVSEDSQRDVPRLPPGAREKRLLAREAQGEMRVLHLGLWIYASRGPRLGIYGAIFRDEGSSVNPDSATAESAITRTLTALREAREGVRIDGLENRIIQLSYADASAAIAALKNLGVTTVVKDAPLEKDVAFESLPIVFELPAPDLTSRGLVGGKAAAGSGQFGSTVVPTIASDLASDMVASPSSRLLVAFHPAHPEQFGRVKKLLDEVIDVPARQVFVEGLILQLSDAAIQELGIEWEFQRGKWNVIGGTLRPDILGADPTLLFDALKSRDLPTDWAARVRALVIDGKIEILSRPSVLTLNGRQATIRIGEDIPIATSQEGFSGSSSKISFDFKYLALGILLNLRPRVSEDGREISLMVDTMVSEEAPAGNIEIRDADGIVRASAPRVNSRRVQTYARIQNNTPFIIGGLVSREKTLFESKVPLLGDIPILRYLFTSKSSQNVRSEVVIVLTPYVLPEKLHLSRALPAGDFLDATDLGLFRDIHRIVESDIFDISFLYRNQRFVRYRDLARRVVRENFRLAESDPFRPFVDGRAPGGSTIAHAIVFNALRRLKAGEAILLERVFLLTDKHAGGYEADSLEEALRSQGGGKDFRSFFENHPGRAIAISFRDLYEEAEGASFLNDPLPEIRVVDCPDRKSWESLLRDLNRASPDGTARNTILLHREEDLERLRIAILLKSVMEVNGGRKEASLLNFIPGRVIEIPAVRPDQPHVLDSEIARFFFESKHYYARAIEEIETAIRALDLELQRPEIQALLDGNAPPPSEER